LVSVPEEREEEDQEPLVAKTLCGVGGYFFCSKIVRNKKNPHPPPYAKGCGKEEDGFRKSFFIPHTPDLSYRGIVSLSGGNYERLSGSQA
jgi:hypothetical protein